MEIVLAILMIVSAAATGALGLFLLTRLVRTIVELRKITVGLNEVLGWSAGQVLAERTHERMQRF
jgi:hypothetical protein